MDAIGNFDLSRNPSGAGPGMSKGAKVLQKGSDRLLLLIQHNNEKRTDNISSAKNSTGKQNNN
jgi:hypothetical protein